MDYAGGLVSWSIFRLNSVWLAQEKPRERNNDESSCLDEAQSEAGVNLGGSCQELQAWELGPLDSCSSVDA